LLTIRALHIFDVPNGWRYAAPCNLKEQTNATAGGVRMSALLGAFFIKVHLI